MKNDSPGRSWAALGRSWVALGSLLATLGALLAALGALVAALEPPSALQVGPSWPPRCLRNRFLVKNVSFQKVVENLSKNHVFCPPRFPKTSQDGSKMAFGPLLGRSGSLLGRLGPLLAALGSLLVRLEALLAALGPPWVRSRQAWIKKTRPAPRPVKFGQSFFAIYRSSDGISSALSIY